MSEAAPPFRRFEAGDEDEREEDDEPDEAFEDGDDDDWLVLPGWFSW